MVNRRGLADNGTNFVGANEELFKQLTKDGKVNDSRVKWTFNPPYVPHFRGCYKATK